MHALPFGRGARIALFALPILALAAVAAIVSSAGGQATPTDSAASARLAIEQMIKAIQDGNTPIRDRMFFKLRIIGKESVAPLVETLAHADPRVRDYAAFTLSFIDDDRAVDPILNLFHNDPEISVRAQAARALGRMEEQRAIDPLIAALKSDRTEIRQDAAYALGLIGDPRANAALQALEIDPNEVVRFMAKDALARIDRAVKRKAAEKK